MFILFRVRKVLVLVFVTDNRKRGQMGHSLSVSLWGWMRFSRASELMYVFGHQHRKTSAAGSFWWATAGRTTKDRYTSVPWKKERITESCWTATDLLLVISRSYLTFFVILRLNKTRFDKRDRKQERKRFLSMFLTKSFCSRT